MKMTIVFVMALTAILTSSDASGPESINTASFSVNDDEKTYKFLRTFQEENCDTNIPNVHHSSDGIITIDVMNCDDIQQTESVFYRGFMHAYGHFSPEQIGIKGDGDIGQYLKDWFAGDHFQHIKNCKNPTYCLAAKKENRVVGYVVFEQLDTIGTIYLYSIAVDPEMHGRGIGRELIQSISDCVPTTKIVVHTRNVNVPAIAFYKKLGFVESDCVSPYYQELAHVLVGFELCREICKLHVQKTQQLNECSLMLRPSPTGGIGLFAVHDIAAGTPVITNTFNTRKMKNTDVASSFKKYCVFLENDECEAPERFDRMESIWFVNHADNANLMRTAPKTAIATRDIKAGEEVFMNYNEFNEPEGAKEAYYAPGATRTNPLVIFARITPKQEYFNAAKEAVLKIIPTTLLEPGCRIFSLHEADGELILYEMWENEEALNLHHEQEYTKAVFAQYEYWLAKPVHIEKMVQVG